MCDWMCHWAGTQLPVARQNYEGGSLSIARKQGLESAKTSIVLISPGRFAGLNTEQTDEELTLMRGYLTALFRKSAWLSGQQVHSSPAPGKHEVSRRVSMRQAAEITQGAVWAGGLPVNRSIRSEAV